ncbi:MAG: sugar phosphate isomerase/epimerase family protein [Sphaerochaetaceae bacterium]
MNKIAFSTGAFYTYETTDALKLIRNSGFDHAELMPQCLEDISSKVLAVSESIRLHISSIHFPLSYFALLYNANPGMQRELRAYVDKLALFSKSAGTEFVVVHPENEYTGIVAEKVGKPIRSSLLYLCEALDKAGVTVAMENYPSGVGQRPDTLDAYVESIGAPNMKVMVDTTEVIEGGGDPVDFISRLENAPCHLHLSDFADGVKHLPIGKGDMDWKAIVGLLKKRGYCGYWTLEPRYQFYLENPEDQLKRDYEFISALV